VRAKNIYGWGLYSDPAVVIIPLVAPILLKSKLADDCSGGLSAGAVIIITLLVAGAVAVAAFFVVKHIMMKRA
jgi:uncharacterized membrane protein